MKPHQEGQHCHLAIESDMTIYEAAELKPTLLKSLASCQELEISLAQVGEMDSAGFQLMVLLKRESQAAGKQVKFVEHSPAVLDALDLYNMVPYFGDPVLVPADRHH